MYAGDGREAVVWGGGRRGGNHMLVFVERRGGALGESVRSGRRQCVEWLSASDAGEGETWEYGAR